MDLILQRRFGCLCQEHGTGMPTGTDTMFFIPFSAIPKGKKATYLRIVAALRLEKKTPIASFSPSSAETKSTMLETSAPKLPILLLSKYFSTVFQQYRLHS
jgi:hypothetical protein